MVTGSVLAASDGDAGAAEVPPSEGDAATVAAGGADDAVGVELPEHAATIAARATAARSRAGAVLRAIPFTMTFLLLVLAAAVDGRTPRRDSQPGSKSRNTPFRSNGCARAADSSISMPMPGRDVGRMKPSTTSGSSGAISRASGTASSTKVSSIRSPGSHAASSTLTAVAIGPRALCGAMDAPWVAASAAIRRIPDTPPTASVSGCQMPTWPRRPRSSNWYGCVSRSPAAIGTGDPSATRPSAAMSSENTGASSHVMS